MKSKINMRSTFRIKIIIAFVIVFLFALPIVVSAQLKNIKNDVFWDTEKGTPIYSQGGGIFNFPDRSSVGINPDGVFFTITIVAIVIKTKPPKLTHLLRIKNFNPPT